MDRVPAIIPFVFCLALVGCSAEKEQQPAYVPVHEQGVTAAPSAGSAAREMTSDRVARRPEIRGPGIQSSTSPNAELPLWPAPAAPAPSTEQIRRASRASRA
jgi:hypothetical protein